MRSVCFLLAAPFVLPLLLALGAAVTAIMMGVAVGGRILAIDVARDDE